MTDLGTTISIYAGGPGSGCQGPNCGRHTVSIRKMKSDDPNWKPYWLEKGKHWSVRVDGNHVGHLSEYSHPETGGGRIAIGFSKAYNMQFDPQKLEQYFPGLMQNRELANSVSGKSGVANKSAATRSAINRLQNIATRMGSTNHTFEEDK